MIRIKNIIVVLLALLLMPFAINAIADEKSFLTVDELINHGYTQLTGAQLSKLLQQKKVEVHDIETEAVSLSSRLESDKGDTVSRKSEEVKNAGSMYFLDTRLLARAPPLQGKPDYTVVKDELVATDGVRTYHIRFYEKQGKVYGARDIDNGNVFFEIIVK